jgi:hypothetical protein
LGLLLLLLIYLAVIALPTGVIGLVTVLTGRFLSHLTHKWLAWGIAAILPVTVLASELYPVWLVRSIARAPARDAARRIAPSSVRGFYDSAASAADLAVSYPNLRFAEAVIKERDLNDRSVLRLGRMPLGPVRFQGSRNVSRPQDCAENEVSVASSAPYPRLVQWHCTNWKPVRRHEAEFRIGERTFREYRVGPYEISEMRDALIRERDGQAFNVMLRVQSTGGLWWHAVEWFGHATGISGISNGTILGKYGATTAPWVGGSPDKFLMTGKTG